MDILWGHNKLPPGIKSLLESKSRKDMWTNQQSREHFTLKDGKCSL